MMKHISILLPLLLALVCLSAYGAESGNEYRKYDVRSGLSNNSVKSILQDRNGYVWLATKDGLNKFNSKDFEAFCSSASGHGLNIDDICEHISRNEIWMASTGGLFVFDAARDSTYSVEPGGVHIQNCNCLCYGKDSCLWIGSNNGLYRFNERLVEIRHYSFCSDAERSPIRIVKSLLVDETGNIYAGMESGLVRYIPELDAFDEPCRLRPGICLNGDNIVTAMLQVSHRQILAGTQNGLVGVLDTRNNTFTESIVRDKDGRGFLCQGSTPSSRNPRQRSCSGPTAVCSHSIRPLRPGQGRKDRSETRVSIHSARTGRKACGSGHISMERAISRQSKARSAGSCPVML